MSAVRKTEMKPGHMAARLLRVLAAAGGSPDRALEMVTASNSPWNDRTVVAGTDETVGKLLGRALLAGSGSAGGFLIPEEYSGEVIDLLRHRIAVRRLGAISVPMPHGNLNLPRLNTGANVSYVGEATAQDATAEAVGNLKLSAKKLLAIVPISNDLIKFSSPSADVVVLNDLTRQMAVAEDAAFIRGTGSQYSPKGMRYWASTTTPSVGASGDTGTTLTQHVQADLVQAIDNLEAADVPMSNPGWIMSPRTKNSIANLTATTGQFIFRDEMATGKLWGYPYVATNNVPTNLNGTTQSELYLADFDEVIIGDAPGIEIDVSRESAYVDGNGNLQSAFSQDVTVVRVIERHDFGLRHDASATVITGIYY